MKPIKSLALALALATATAGAAAPVLADTAAAETVDPTQVSKLVTDIEAAISAAGPGASIRDIERAINHAIAADGFSAAVNGAALQVVQTAEAAGSNASVAVAALSSRAGTVVPGAGGQGGGAPIGGLVSGGASGSGYISRVSH